MVTNKTKLKEVDDDHDLHTVHELDEELVITNYADTACKMGKEWYFSWPHVPIVNQRKLH